MSGHLADALSQVARRLSYAATCLSNEAAEGPRLERALRACASWEDLAAWGNALPDTLVRSPLRTYVHAICQRRSARADLDLSEWLVTRPDPSSYGGVEVEELSGAAAASAFVWGQEALLAWATWAPALDRELFELMFEGDWPAADVNDLAAAAVQELVPKAPGHALALRYYEDAAAIVSFEDLRACWADLIEGVDDFLIVPITPPVGAWAICWFHHDTLEVGRLRRPWLHGVTLPPWMEGPNESP